MLYIEKLLTLTSEQCLNWVANKMMSLSISNNDLGTTNSHCMSQIHSVPWDMLQYVNV